jgi:hypothetical protein
MAGSDDDGSAELDGSEDGCDASLEPGWLESSLLGIKLLVISLLGASLEMSLEAIGWLDSAGSLETSLEITGSLEMSLETGAGSLEISLETLGTAEELELTGCCCEETVDDGAADELWLADELPFLPPQPARTSTHINVIGNNVFFLINFPPYYFNHPLLLNKGFVI